MVPLKKLQPFHFSVRQYCPWLAAGFLLCGSAWLGSYELPVQRAENATVAAKIRVLEAQFRAQMADPFTAQQNLAAQLAGFDSLSLMMADLQSLTTQNGLMMSDASFKPTDNLTAAGIGRVEVNTRIKGAYLPLKKTLTAMLATHGGLALDSLSLRRARASDVAMEIDVRFTYFYRKPS